MTLDAGLRAVQKSAPTSGLSTNGNSGGRKCSNTHERTYHSARKGAASTTYPWSANPQKFEARFTSQFGCCFRMRNTKSYSPTTPSTTTALSLQNTPTAVANISSSNHGSLPQPPAVQPNASVVAPNTTSATTMAAELRRSAGTKAGYSPQQRTNPASPAEAIPSPVSDVRDGLRFSWIVVLL